jgi:hypothetical protein
MLRRVPIYLLLAVFVAGGSSLAAQTKAPAPPAKTGKAATAPAAKAAAPKAAAAAVTPADAAPFLGTWEIPLETPTGRLVATLVVRVEAGKVVAGVRAPQFPEHKITDVTKAGQVLRLKASTNYSGPLTSFSGPVTMVMTLTPKGPDMAAWLDFNDSGYQIGGTAKKKA